MRKGLYIVRGPLKVGQPTAVDQRKLRRFNALLQNWYHKLLIAAQLMRNNPAVSGNDANTINRQIQKYNALVAQLYKAAQNGEITIEQAALPGYESGEPPKIGAAPAIIAVGAVVVKIVAIAAGTAGAAYIIVNIVNRYQEIQRDIRTTDKLIEKYAETGDPAVLQAAKEQIKHVNEQTGVSSSIFAGLGKAATVLAVGAGLYAFREPIGRAIKSIS